MFGIFKTLGIFDAVSWYLQREFDASDFREGDS